MGDRKVTRVTGAARDTLAGDFKRRYELGASIRDLSDESGKSYGFVHRLLGEAGAQFRGRGGATRKKSKPQS
jgi:hypothetical protein